MQIHELSGKSIKYDALHPTYWTFFTLPEAAKVSPKMPWEEIWDYWDADNAPPAPSIGDVDIVAYHRYPSGACMAMVQKDGRTGEVELELLELLEGGDL